MGWDTPSAQPPNTLRPQVLVGHRWSLFLDRQRSTPRPSPSSCSPVWSKQNNTMAKSGSDHRKVIEMMKEATGASDDEVCLMLQLHDGDPNKATEALLSSACVWLIGAMSAPRLCCCAAPCQRAVLTILAGSFRRSFPGGGEQEGQAGKGAAAIKQLRVVFAAWAASAAVKPTQRGVVHAGGRAAKEGGRPAAQERSGRSARCPRLAGQGRQGRPV